MTVGPPSASDPDLTAIWSDSRGRLIAAVADRDDPWRTPVLATAALDGGAQARTVVLRAFAPDARALSIHTDRRAAKVAELVRDPRASLLFWAPILAIQLRVVGRIAVHVDDARSAAAWNALPQGGRAIYAVRGTPGQPVALPPPAPHDPAAGRANFALLCLHFDRLDWLRLVPEGHRRARFDWTGAAWSASWLVP